MTARPLRLDHSLWDRSPAWKVVKSYDHYVCLFIVNDELNGTHKNEYFQSMRKLGMISMDESANVKQIRNPARRNVLDREIISIIEDAVEAYEER